MGNENPVLGNEESDRDVDFKPVIEQAPDRRRIFRKLLALAGLGITGALLSQDKTGLLPTVKATNPTVTTESSGTNTSGYVAFWDSGTDITSDSGGNFTWGSVFGLKSIAGQSGVFGGANNAGGIGVEGEAFSTSGSPVGVLGVTEGYASVPSSGPVGVQGEANTGTGVLGQSISGTGVVGSTTSGYAGLFTGGNVGIGTTTPSSLLTVHGASGTVDQIRIEQGGTGNADILTAAGSAATAMGTTSSGIGFVGTTSNNDLKIQVANNARIYLPAGGGVGIGTTSPPLQLSIVDESGANSRGVQLMENYSSAGAAVMNFYKSRGTNAAPTAVANGDYVHAFSAFAYSGSTYLDTAGFLTRVNGSVTGSSVPTDLALYTKSTGTNDPYGDGVVRLVVSGANGNVGIGTTTPTHLIQLNGGAYCTGTGAWIAGSSVRWKENITPLTDGVDTLKQLHPVSYNRKETPGKTTMGFIAEEVGKVLPTVVDWDRKEPGYAEGYDHLAILALSVQAVKELATRNSKQETTIQQLQERIAVLERTVKQFTAS